MITIQKKYFYLYFGLLAGLAFILYNELNNSVLKNASGISSIIGMLAHFFILLYSVKYYIKNFADGHIRFWQVYKKAIIITIIGSVLNSIYLYIAYKLKPGLLADFKAMIEETYLNSGMPEDQVEMISAAITPVVISIVYFIYITFGGLLLGLIVSSISRKEQNPLEKAE